LIPSQTVVQIKPAARKQTYLKMNVSHHATRIIFLAAFVLTLFLVSRESYHYLARHRNSTTLRQLLASLAGRKVAAFPDHRPIKPNRTTAPATTITSDDPPFESCGMPFSLRTPSGACRTKIAIAVNIIAGRDPPANSDAAHDYESFIDAAGVLAHALRTRVVANSRFDIELVYVVFAFFRNIDVARRSLYHLRPNHQQCFGIRFA
jgi:hypothetical protein